MGRLGVLTATTGAVVGVLWAVVLASGFRHESESEWSDAPLEDEAFEHSLSRPPHSSMDGLAPSFLVAPQGQRQPVLPKFDQRAFRSLTLANGLDVLLVRDPLLTVAKYSVVVGVGENNNPEDWPGLTFLLTMLGYQDPTHRELVKKFNGDKRGGFHNGDRDWSFLSAEFDATGLDQVSAARADWLQNARLNSTSDAQLNKAMKVVGGEYKKAAGGVWFQILAMLVEKSAAERSPLSRFTRSGTKRTFTERGIDQLIAQLQKHYESFYCPKNMHLVIVSPLPLQRMEDSAKNSFGSLDRECSASRGSEKEEPHVSPLQLEVSPGAEPRAGMGGSPAEGRCPAATEPAASQVGRYCAPFAVLQEANWGEAFPKENLGKQFLAKAPARASITILFPLPIFELYRKVDFYGVHSYLKYVFRDLGHKSLRTVLRKESLIVDEGLGFSLETSKAGSFLLVLLILTDEADENAERRTLLWRTLFRWFQQLQVQTTDDLLGFLGPIKQLKDVVFTWGGRDAVSSPTDLAISLTRNEPAEVVRGESVISDISACLLRAILESLTASNMNYAYLTNRAEIRLPAENSHIMPRDHFNYTESPIPASVMQAASVDHTRAQEVGLPAPGSQNPTTGETVATALSISLPKPMDNVPSVKQHLHDVVDQKETPIAVLGSDLYFYAPQPKAEQEPTVRINFLLKDVDDFDPAPAAFGSRPGSASSSCGRDISLRCRMLGTIRTRIVRRLLDPLLNVFYKVGNGYGFRAWGSRMTFDFLAFPDQIEELMRIVVGVALDPITGSGSSGSALAESTNVRKLFRQEVKEMQAQLEDIAGMGTAGHHARSYQWIILRKKVFSREEKLRWLKQYTTRSGTQHRQTDQRQEENVRSDATFAGTNLDALWTEFEGYLSEEAEGRRRFRMTSLAAGNLDLETAQRYERTMRELLTATNRTTSASSTSSARGLSLVDPGTTMGASRLALQDRVLRLENDTPNKQIEMRVVNPVPEDKSQHVTRMTLQFGTPETAEEEALLYLVWALVDRETHKFLRKNALENNVGGVFFTLGSVWHYTVHASGDSMNPDQIVPLIYENNRRIREMLGNLTTTEILHSARTLLKNKSEPFTTVSDLFNHALLELSKGTACFQRDRAMVKYLNTTLVPRLEEEKWRLEAFDYSKDKGFIDKNFSRTEFKQSLDARLFPEPDPDDDDDEEETPRGISVAKEEVEDAGGFKGHASKRAPAGGRLADIEEDAEEEQDEADSSDASSRGDNHQAGPTSGIQAQLVAIFDRFLNGPALTIKLFNSTSHHLIAQDPPHVILPGNKLAKPVAAEAGASPCSVVGPAEAVPKQQGPDDLHEVAKVAKGIATAMQTPKPDVLKCGPDGVCVLRKVPDFEEKTNMLTLRNFGYWERSKMCAALAGVR